jgi:sulfite exporter TauE/SafE
MFLRMLPLPLISLAFFTGLTSGGFSCVAIQGGLMSSALSKIPQKGIGLASFLVAKLGAYILLGFILGSVGQGLNLSFTVQGWLQIFAGLYMLATAANLMNLHPIFRYTVIMPPKFLLKSVKSKAKGESIFTPALLGAFTIFLPCGVTQSMMILSLSSGSGASGAAILGVFTLATIPQFIALGAAASIFFSKRFFRICATLVVVYLGFLSINTGQILRGSPHTAQNYWYAIRNTSPDEAFAAPISGGIQQVHVGVTTNGYTTSSHVIRSGIPVSLTLESTGVQGCARDFSIPSLNIVKPLPENGVEKLEFTPKQKGLLTYSCNQGLHVGSFEVI